MKNPFEECRAFSAWLVKVDEEVALNHLWTCLREGGKDNMAYDIAEYYDVLSFSQKTLETILSNLKKDSKNYDLSGFKFLDGETK